MGDSLNISVPKAREILGQLDIVSVLHEQWIDNLHRALLCNEPIDPSYTDVDGNDKCEMGKWLYDLITKQSLELDILTDVNFLHKRLHDSIRQLVIQFHSTGSVSTTDFDQVNAKKNALEYNLSTLRFLIFDHVFNIDPLTLAFNRNKLLSTLERERERVSRTDEQCSIVMVDLDFFKKINDTYGHLFGDVVLSQLASFLRNSLRPMDLIFRYGGEEFLLYLPSTDKKTALSVLDRIRSDIEKNEFMISNDDQGQHIHVTASFGVSKLEPTRDIGESIKLADQALYKAKSDGRNRVVWAD
jgi:diguanylate cyclase